MSECSCREGPAARRRWRGTCPRRRVAPRALPGLQTTRHAERRLWRVQLKSRLGAPLESASRPRAASHHMRRRCWCDMSLNLAKQTLDSCWCAYVLLRLAFLRNDQACQEGKGFSEFCSDLRGMQRKRVDHKMSLVPLPLFRSLIKVATLCFEQWHLQTALIVMAGQMNSECDSGGGFDGRARSA